MDTTARASAAASATLATAAAYSGTARLGLRRGSTVAVGRNDHVSVPRSTAKHGRRRHFGRYGRATWNSASLSRPSHAMTSNCSCSGRWRRRVESPHDDHRTTSHSKRLEALTDVLLELRSSRLLVVSSRLLCSNSNVELHCSLDNDFPARNSLADANCTEISCARIISAGHDCSVEQVISSSAPKPFARGTNTGAMPATSLLRHRPAAIYTYT